MNTFVKNINTETNIARTQNGMKALNSTTSSCVDLFFKIGASRGQKVGPLFLTAYAENSDHALRIAQWARDVRLGAGERQLFRDIMLDVEKYNVDSVMALIKKVPEIGRWDDLLVEFTTTSVRHAAFNLIKEALDNNNGLTAKWMPRQGAKARELREYFGWTPKYYRKRLVELTKVVESQMCAKNWDGIDFNKVPSLAGSRYKKAFNRHTPKYAEWTTKLVSTDPEVKKTVKVNAGAVYPYDVLKGMLIPQYGVSHSLTKAELDNVTAQWDALPNFMDGKSILPIVDVSGSMGNFGYHQKNTITNITPFEIAMSLGLYVSDKSQGAFKDVYIAFSETSKLYNLKGNIVDKIDTIAKTPFSYSNTNLHAAFENILTHAVNNKVPETDMPQIILIMSDMQFDSCAKYDDSAIQMIRRKYNDAGYEMPQTVFWNINASDNVPVTVNAKGVALVSGFSPSIIKSILSCDIEEITPTGMMLKTIMSDRYAL